MKRWRFSYLRFYSPCDFILFLLSFSFPVSPANSDSHHYASALLLQLLRGLPWPLVTPPQAILQTSTEQMSPCLTVGLLLLRWVNPTHDGLPPTGFQYSPSTSLQDKTYLSEELATHACLCSHHSPHWRALRLPWPFPESRQTSKARFSAVSLWVKLLPPARVHWGLSLFAAVFLY